MNSYISVQQAAALRGCTERSIQMLCKQGSIPGAVKFSGVWMIPDNSFYRETEYDEKINGFRPEKLYGKNTTVRVSSCPVIRESEDNGCTITRYNILNGITLVFQDIHEENMDYGNEIPCLPENLIAIQHCREGRFEGAYSNGEYIYMGPGCLSVNLPAYAPVSNSFPLKHYHGFYIAILPEIAEESINKLEKVLGPMHIDFSSLSEKLSGKNRLAIFSADDKTEQLISSVYPCCGKIHEEQLKLRVLELLQLLCMQKNLPTKPEKYFSREQVRTVKKIRQYLISHLDCHIPLRELAVEFHISLTGMKNCFKGVYGQPIGKHLREFRMQAAAEQLVSTDYRIIEIAAALGYENASKFAEAFAGYYGMSPNEYRKSFCPAGAVSDI